MPEEILQIRVHGADQTATLIYLPGLHGDWTLVTGFRLALANRIQFVEITYPRTLNWSVADYAAAIARLLLEQQITHGWLLGESWGSQVAWEMMRQMLDDSGTTREGFKADGIILAGGFVKHPWKWGPGLLRRIGEMTSMESYRRQLKSYARYARFRHRHSPEAMAAVEEFIARRTDLDRQAMRARLRLLDEYDPRPIARRTTAPVHYLAGLVDPLIPWVLVRWWLRRNCPGYRGGKTFWLSDHNVLASSAARGAEQVVRWMLDESQPVPMQACN